MPQSFLGAIFNPVSAARNALQLGVVCAISVGAYLLNVGIADSRAADAGLPTTPQWRIGCTVLLLVAQTVPLWWRRLRPTSSFVLFFALYLASILVAGNRFLVTGAILIYAIVAFAASTRPGRTVLVLAIAASADVAAQLMTTGLSAQHIAQRPDLLFVASYQAGGGIALFAVLGFFVRGSNERVKLANERVTLIERERDAQTAAAIARERIRMSRELHDIAAHHVTSVIAHTELARLTARSEPEATVAALDQIRSEAQLTLNNLREIFRILRSDDGAARGRVPQPGIAALDELISGLREQGEVIGLTLHGELDDVPEAVSMAAFRIVQESLTNARKHARGAPCTVRVRRLPDRLDVRVDDSGVDRDGAAGEPGRGGPADERSSGWGIVGMTERATLLGGSLVAEPNGSGWRTSAVLPIPPDAAPATGTGTGSGTGARTEAAP